MITIAVYRCPLAPGKVAGGWHYCHIEALPMFLNDNSNDFRSMPEAHAAACADASVPSDARIVLRAHNGTITPLSRDFKG